MSQNAPFMAEGMNYQNKGIKGVELGQLSRIWNTARAFSLMIQPAFLKMANPDVEKSEETNTQINSNTECTPKQVSIHFEFGYFLHLMSSLSELSLYYHFSLGWCLSTSDCRES